MGSQQPDSEIKQDFDDSGCVQDEPPPANVEPAVEENHRNLELMDLPDDVLLCILRFCKPRDLKALGYSCPRFGALVCDRSLWQFVDSRTQPCGRERLRWMLAHVLSDNTTDLLLSGYARDTRGCLGHSDLTRKEAEELKAKSERRRQRTSLSDNKNERASSSDAATAETSAESEAGPSGRSPPYPLTRQHARLNINPQPLPRSNATPSWPDEWADSDVALPYDEELNENKCNGPLFTLNQCLMQDLKAQCWQLRSLSLQYCNINCKTTGLSQFPSTLKKLSLRGVKCYNLPLDKSFLFKIQDYLPLLECLDLSECEWMEPASLLPLSKSTTLRHLLLRHCYRMSEFVAYASLATRYGFRALKLLDLRGSPVGDSEVSALGWVPELEQLMLSPAPAVPPWPKEHSHHRGDPPAEQAELESWELQEPEYFQFAPKPTEINVNTPSLRLRDLRNGMSLAGKDYITCGDGMRIQIVHRRNLPRGWGGGDDRADDQPGPSVKRPRPDNNDAPDTSTHKKHKPDSDDDDDDVTGKRKYQRNVNEGASTSKTTSEHEGPSVDEAGPSSGNSGGNSILKPPSDSSSSSGPKPDSDSSDNDDENPKNGDGVRSSSSSVTIKAPDLDRPSGQRFQQFIRLRQNEEPVIVRCRRYSRDDPPEDPGLAAALPDLLQAQANQQGDPRHQILYVNVGQQLHAVYRLLPSRPIFHSMRNRNWRPSIRNIFYSPPTPHLDATSLVTDAAVRRFGRAEGEDINYIQIGPNGPCPAGSNDVGGRPDRSNLRVLSITGFRHITDRSLIHLATAAPNLRRIDFSETSVTAQGVAEFRSLRPDCEVIYSAYVDRTENKE